MDQPEKSLNLTDAVMIVSGSMIGSGIFIVAADMTRVLGSPFWVLICWLLSGLITLFAALSYGELAGMMPEAGGQFIYIKKAYGKLTAFVYGWTVFTVIQTGVIAAVAVAFARFMGVLFPFFDEKNIVLQIGAFELSSTKVLAVISIFFLSFLNSRGINNGKLIQKVFTSTKIIALLGLIVLGLFISGEHSYWSKNMDLSFHGTNGDTSTTALLSAIGVALIGSLFSSDAWNNVTFIAGEIKDPKKNIPLGLLIGVLLVTVLYILANVAYFILLPALGSETGKDVIERGVAFAQNDRVGTAALNIVLGDLATVVMAVLIIISTFGCNNGLILSGARLFQAMANEGLFFKAAANTNRFHAPSTSLWIQAIWASVLCLSGSYGSLLDYCTFASLVFYIITISTVFYFRFKMPDAPRPYKAFGYPIIPALYIIITLFICIDLLIFKPQNTVWGLVIMFIGIPVYYLFQLKKIKEFINNYFGFNRQQRRGLLVMCSMCLLLLGVRMIYPYFITPDEIVVENLPLLKSDSGPYHPGIENSKSTGSVAKVELHSFDPNQVGFEELCSLGFSKKTARIFLKFRSKGFVFRNKSDLKKVYGVNDSLYIKLSPFIRIESSATSEKISNVPTNSKVNGRTIELNAADSAALTELNGIGPSFARRIIKYRELLGGYSNKEQLREVYGLNEELFEKIKGNVSVNASLIKRMNLNESDFKTINRHPYLSYEITRSIVNQRKIVPITPEVLKEILQDDDTFEKLKAYIAY